MHIRASLLTLATVLSVSLPVAASACGTMDESMGMSFMSTPVSAKGRFVFVNRISRRQLRHAVTERRQSTRVSIPLQREIL